MTTRREPHARIPSPGSGRVVPAAWAAATAATASRRFRRDLSRWAVRATYGDRDAADEVLADVYLRLVRHLPDVRDLKALRIWLRTMVRNVARDRWRREQAHQRARASRHATDPDAAGEPGDLPDIPVPCDIEQTLQREDRHALLLALVQRLPPVERQVVRARFGLGRDERDGPRTLVVLARELGCSISTVHRIEQRGLARLRAMIDRRQARSAVDDMTISAR